jgi:ketosteroid isomerase-like protein
MGTIAENIELVMAFFDASVKGRTDELAKMLHDDFRAWTPGNQPWSGWKDKAQLLKVMEMVMGDDSPDRLSAGPMTLSVGTITAQDDRVVFEAEGDMPLTDGRRYNNFYLYAVRVRDSKILEFKEFDDTQHTEEIFGSPSATPDAKKARESPVEQVTRTLGGA